MAARLRTSLRDGGSTLCGSAARGIFAARHYHLWFCAAMICMRFCEGPDITILD